MIQQTTFSKVNTCGAWFVFAVAAMVYGMTVEPTASFWDCPEFIASGYKLEIGHPPGAPVYMLAANLFSQFASNTSQVALMVNLLSTPECGLHLLPFPYHHPSGAETHLPERGGYDHSASHHH